MHNYKKKFEDARVIFIGYRNINMPFFKQSDISLFLEFCLAHTYINPCDHRAVTRLSYVRQLNKWLEQKVKYQTLK